MGIGKITEARETTEGTLSSPQGGAGAAAEKLASVGDRAGREAHQTISKGLGDAAKNIGDALKVAGDFAVKTLWEKPIAEAEEKIRELDVKCRKEGWRDLHGVERPGFELYRGVEAMDVGERWDAYMARESRKITQELGLSDGQREELSRRTRKLRVETKARLVEFGLNEAMTSNLRDIDIRATRGAERSILDAVDRANADRDTLAKDAAYHSGNAEDGAAVLSRKDDAAAVGLFDALAEKRAGLIRDKVIGGLGRKSEAQATAEADALVRAEALETVKALAAAGHYERARKLVEQGRRAVDDGGARLFDDAALANGRELVDGMEEKAQKDAFNGVRSVAQSAVASGMLASVKDPQTGALLPGMEDAIGDIRDAKQAYAPGSELRAAYDRLEAEVTAEAEKTQSTQYLTELANLGRTDAEPMDEIKAEPWKLRAFEAAKGKYLKAVEQQGKDLRAARDLIWKENADSLKRLEAAYFQARAREGGWNSRATDLAYANLKRTWNQIGLGGVSGEFAKTFLGDLKDIDNEEIVEGMTEFWRMLKGVKVIGPKDSRSREASSGGPELDKYGSLTDATVRHMDLGEEVGFDTGDEGRPFTMTVDEALVFSEQVRHELRRMDPKERRKSEVVRDVVKKVYVNAAKAMVKNKIRDGEKAQVLAREFGEQMTNLRQEMEKPSLKAALDERERQDEVQKPYRQAK